MLVCQNSDNDQLFQQICREHGWKRTAQRRAVFNCLCGNRAHPSVETVWRSVRETMPDVSLDSVYRILDDFHGAGLIRRLEGAKIIRYDADTGSHDHFVCQQCGTMYDFSFLEADRVSELCGAFGDVTAVELVVRGVCASCRNR